MAKPLPWSHSSLEGFSTCPRQYEEIKVLRNFQDAKNPASIWGDEFHHAAEVYIKYRVQGFAIAPLPENMTMYKEYLEGYVARGATAKVLVEQKYALDTNLAPCDFYAPMVWGRGIIDVLTIQGTTAWVDDHKGLALDTLIPTPKGFVTMADIKVGDKVFGSNGKPCKVHTKSGIHNRPCFRVTFTDKSHVVCDNVHLWKLLSGDVVPITEMGKGDRIPLAQPLALREADLPIDPYVLGMWLADGKHTSAEISKPDLFIWEEIQRRGYTVNMRTGGKKSCPTRTVQGIRAHLSALGVLGDKHIPAIYMRASYKQRLDLLHGLMDGDGSANRGRKMCVFSQCNERLATQVKELLCSLGQRPTLNRHTARGFDLVVQVSQVSFKPQGINPFLLPRKADLVLASWGKGDSWNRRVLAIDPVESVPTQCIGVSSPDNTYLCTEDFIVTHNTGKNRKKDMQQLIVFALMTFYHHPEIMCAHCAYHWLQLGAKDTETFYRHQIPELWATLMPKLQDYRKAFKRGLFPPKPSGLCKKHCAVETCEYFQRGPRG